MYRQSVFRIILFMVFCTEAYSQEFSIGINFAPKVVESSVPKWNIQENKKYGAFLQWKKNRIGLTLGVNFMDKQYTSEIPSEKMQTVGGNVYSTFNYYIFENTFWRLHCKVGLEFSNLTKQTSQVGRVFEENIYALSPMTGLEAALRKGMFEVASGIDFSLLNEHNSIYKPFVVTPYLALKIHLD